MKAHIQSFKSKAMRYVAVVMHEAAELLRRRKFSYAILALTLTAGSLYFSGVRPALATSGGQAPMPASNDGSTQANQPQVLQTVTGQSANQPNDNEPSQGASSDQTHTSVTVNGTDIPVPSNGEVHKTMTNDGSTTSVSVSHNSSGDNSYSSLNVQVSSQGTASEEGD